MTTQFQKAYENITIPVDLEQRVLAACLGAKRPSPIRYWMPAASMAACGAVLLVSLAATGRLESSEELFTQPGINPPAGVTIPNNNSPTTLSTSPTTAVKGDATTVTTQSILPLSSSEELAYCKRSLPGDEKTMTLAQLTAYFGRRIQPAWLPEDMEMLQTSYGYSVYYRNEEKMQNLTAWEQEQFKNGTWRDDEVIYDQNAILYRGEDGQELSVAMSTAPYPRNLLGDMRRFDEAITVAGVTAKLAYYDDSTWGGQAGYSYTLLFTVDGVEFKVSAWNLPRSEFLKVAESIIK